MNKYLCTGRLTRDPKVTYSQGEKPTAIARFTLAIDRDTPAKEGEQTADFPSFVAFGKTAEFVEKYLKQGTKIEVIGRLTTGSYTNKEGVTVYTTDVTCESIRFAESKAAAGSRPANAAPAQQTASAPAPEPVTAAPEEAFLDDGGEDDDYLPFG